MVGVIDCNSFFASCEKVFRPDLRNRPLAILSNNDGCIVAMTADLKKQGIKRGTPYYKIKDKLAACSAQVFSSNYKLYQSLSNRVMRLVSEHCAHATIYSVDEAFFDIDAKTDMRKHCEELHRKIMRGIGIPSSIGVGRTRTLAKIALLFAKDVQGSVMIMNKEQEDTLLSLVDVKDIWGIGYRKTQHLKNEGIHTALAFRNLDEYYVTNVHGAYSFKTQQELKGNPQFNLEAASPIRKGIMSSRSFAKKLHDRNSLYYALASNANTAVYKLQKQKCRTHSISIFLYKKMNSQQRHKWEYLSQTTTLSVGTNDLSVILKVIKQSLGDIYQSDQVYRKSGVFLSGIEQDRGNLDIFAKDSQKHHKLLELQHSLQKQYGRKAFTLLPALHRGSWDSQKTMLSPEYTTNWSEIPIVHA